MDRLIIDNAAVILPDGIRERQQVCCEDGKIVAVLPMPVAAETAAGMGTRRLDAKGAYLAPGYIDLHLHGMQHARLDDGPDALVALCALLPRYGVTACLPTLTPRVKGPDAAFARSMAAAVTRTTGAKVLGFHFEGPFLAITGALPPEALGPVDLPRAQALRQAVAPLPAVFSVSPEFKGLSDLLPVMTAGGVPAFITHTRAGVADTLAAVAAGARHATHFYDVFYAPDVSEPGVRPCGAVEVILADPRVSVDFILDGVHVDPMAVLMALQCKGPGGVCLITDANVGAGLPPGRYPAFGEEIEIAFLGAPARMTAQSRQPGVLAGSGLTMDQAVRNAVHQLGVPPHQAVRMAGLNPASVLGCADRKGRIAPGYDADMILLDRDLKVRRTWVGGVEMYKEMD